MKMKFAGGVMKQIDWPMTQPSTIHEWGKCDCKEDVIWQIDGKFGARTWVCFTCGYAERGSE